MAERGEQTGQRGPYWEPVPLDQTDGDEPAPSAPDPGRAPGRHVQFHEDRQRLCRLIFWNTVATFLTLGLYRFWARTRLRRYFWHRIWVAGSPGEYMGRGRELFGGFAIVFALLGAIFLSLMIAGLLASAGQVNAVLVNALPYVLILALAPAALYRARRYRFSRTVWRGIRLGQDGSTRTYMLIWLGWFALTVLTLGFTYPWRNVETERYRVTTTQFGNRHFGFELKASRLLSAWLPAWGALLVFLTALALLGAWWSLYLRVSNRTLDVNQPTLSGPLSDFYAISPALWAGLVLAGAAVFFFAFLRYRVQEFRAFVGAARLGEARFQSGLSYRDALNSIGPFVLGLVGYLVISFSMVAIMVQIIARLPAQAQVNPAIWFLIGLVLISALIILFFASYGISLLFNLTMRSRLITAICSTLSIDHMDAIDSIEQHERRAPRFGEGLADAFDFGNF